MLHLQKHINNSLLSNWFYLSYCLLSFILFFLYLLFIEKGFDFSDEGFYLAKINGNILNGAEAIPFEKVVNLYLGTFNITRILTFRIINIVFLTSSAFFFSYSLNLIIHVNRDPIVKLSYYSSSLVSVLFFLNYYPNNISYNTLNVSFVLLTIGSFILFHKSLSKFSYLFLILSAFFLSHLFLIKIPTFFLFVFCLSVFILIFKKKTFFITFFSSVAIITFLLLHLTNIDLKQYIHTLLFSGIKGSHSLIALLSLTITYINNYFLIIFLASSILIAFKLISNLKTHIPKSQIVFYNVFCYLVFFYFLYFFYYFIGRNGYGNEIFLVLFLVGLLSYCQIIFFKNKENRTIDSYSYSILYYLWHNVNDCSLIIIILFTPILASIGTNNFFSFAIIPYLVFISVPVLGISHRSKKFHLNKFLLLSILLLFMFKGFYLGYLKKPYSVFISENKLSENIEYSKSLNLNGIKIGPVLARQITFIDSIFNANEYQKGDTMITFNYCDGIPFIMDAKILFSPIVHYADTDYYSVINSKLFAVNKLYIIDKTPGKISDTITLQKLGIFSRDISKIGCNSVLSLFVYKKHKKF